MILVPVVGGSRREIPSSAVGGNRPAALVCGPLEGEIARRSIGLIHRTGRNLSGPAKIFVEELRPPSVLPHQAPASLARSVACHRPAAAADVRRAHVPPPQHPPPGGTAVSRTERACVDSASPCATRETKAPHWRSAGRTPAGSSSHWRRAGQRRSRRRRCRGSLPFTRLRRRFAAGEPTCAAPPGVYIAAGYASSALMPAAEITSAKRASVVSSEAPNSDGVVAVMTKPRSVSLRVTASVRSAARQA